MNKYKIIEKKNIICPMCNTKHEVELREREALTIIKNEEISYKERYYYCENANEYENEFSSGKMENENLMNARNQYRKNHGLLTSFDIVSIREKYNLTQIELAQLLGWGEATISRYESKAIQDVAYDNILRLIKDNPMAVLEFLAKNSSKFSNEKLSEIKSKISEENCQVGKEFISRKRLECEYIDYQEESMFNGFTKLNIDKLECVINYFASKLDYLYKVKLAKLLWYCDSYSYKKYNHAITGLVYAHNNMGALPIGHNQIVNLDYIKKEEEYNDESTKIHFLYNPEIDMSILSLEEMEILEAVLKKFGKYKRKDLVEYMHNEEAYKKTKQDEIISFDLAKKIKDF